jgi:outer membrane protein TolC
MEDRRALNLEIAGVQREQAEERYRLGAGSLAERLQAEALAREAERQAIIARYAMLRGLAQLQLASGNGQGGSCLPE